MTHRESIGRQIAELREARGLSVRKLAELSGISYQNISKIEHGKYNVSVDILGRVTDAMGAELRIIEGSV